MKNEKIDKKNAVFEKRKWVGITSKCNNRCIFCLDGDIKNKFHKSLPQIKKEFDLGLAEGCIRLILSGGDPTVHPDFIEIIKLGRESGYKKIQIITNGRMFSYPIFLKKAIKAGLNEITFSIHGHNPKIHDSLTSVNGSFEQTVKGIKNALSVRNLIVSADIVLNKKNVKYFPEIIIFLLKLGIREFDILQIMPFGNAIKNKDILFYSIENNLDNINKGFNIAKKYGAVLWTNRFPPQYLENNEDLIQDPYKLFDEVNGRKKDFEYSLSKNIPLKCHGERCPLCCLEPFCNFVSFKNELLKFDKKIITTEEKEITITKQNFAKLSQNYPDDSIFSLITPAHDYQNYEFIVPRIRDILPHLYNAIEKTNNPSIKNIPHCFINKKYYSLIKKENKKIIKKCYLDGNSNIDITKIAKYYIGHQKTKSLRCKKCIFNEQCDGIFQKYIMTYGFKELNPITK